MKKLIYPILFLALIACDMQVELQQPDDEYIIPAGKHTSNRPFKGFDGTTLKFDAKFHTCAEYQSVAPENQADINKLLGFSSCSSHHHQNSARVGWRWYNDQLEIFAYVYDKGKRKAEFITVVPVGEYVHYEISNNQQGYLFKVNETEKQITTSSSCTGTANYMLWPYFGGDETAPHDITLKVDILEEEGTSNNEPTNSDG